MLDFDFCNYFQRIKMWVVEGFRGRKKNVDASDGRLAWVFCTSFPWHQSQLLPQCFCLSTLSFDTWQEKNSTMCSKLDIIKGFPGRRTLTFCYPFKILLSANRCSLFEKIIFWDGLTSLLHFLKCIWSKRGLTFIFLFGRVWAGVETPGDLFYLCLHKKPSKNSTSSWLRGW